MSELPPSPAGSKVRKHLEEDVDRLVYVLPNQVLGQPARDEINLRDLWKIFWRGRWKVIAVASLCVAAAVVYVFLAEEWFRAEVLLAPTDQTSSAPTIGQLGGLAALAGINVKNDDSAEAIATLRSRELARDFIEDLALLPVLLADEWDPRLERWRNDDPTKWPDVRDAVRFFHETVLHVTENGQTGLVTLAIEWTDPRLAAEWATELVARVNEKLRERALGEAARNVAYLQDSLEKTNVVTLQQAISRLLESELQKLMLAKGNADFAFHIIDAAEPPKEPEKPKRALIVVIAAILGGMLGSIWVFLAEALRLESDSESANKSAAG